MGTPPASVLAQLARGFAAQFQLAAPPAARQNWELPVLLLLLAGAAIVRFWGLGAYSLHKPDEDTTVLAAVHIFKDGMPRFPSGMLYTRAMVQSYLMAGAVLLFGENEFAWRLPSVLCGLFLVLVAWRLGRRFLAPAWNMAFVGVVAFLPALVSDSQEARMYIFLLASVAVYALLIFDWERTDRTGYLLGAIGVMMLGIQFQQLAIFASLIVFFPGLVRGDMRRLRQGALAFVPIVLYFVYVRWTPSPYPEAADNYATVAPALGQAPSSFGLRLQPLVTLVAVLGGSCVALLMTRTFLTRGAGRSAALLATGLLLAGFLAQAALLYHVALLSFLAGLYVARRNSALSTTVLLLAGMLAAALAGTQIAMLHDAGAGSLRKIFGVLMGRPSVWPYLITASASVAACAAILAGLLLLLWRAASRVAIPDYWLFFALAVWLPLLGIGMSGWYFPARYTEFALLPLIVTALAVCQQFLTPGLAVTGHRGDAAGAVNGALAGNLAPTTPAAVMFATVFAVLMINPAALARTVNPGASFPDHRASAAWLRAAHPGPRDIVIAEEVLLQTYYYGRVDYWLIDKHVAALLVVRHEGEFVDQYTHTRVLGSGAELEAVIAKADRGRIFIIGSGEGQEDGRRYLRGREIAAILESGRFKVAYTAPDGLSKVYVMEAPGSGATAAH